MIQSATRRKRMQAASVSAAIVGCAALVAGWTTAPPVAPLAASLLTVGKQAPDWTLMDRHGEARSLSDHRGEYVLLDFWATWCGPCRAVMPRVQALHEQYKDKGLAVYGVNISERDPQDAVEHMDEKGYTYGLLLEGDEVAGEYGVSEIPTLFLIDPDGKVVNVHVGVLDGNAFDVFLKNAMKKHPPTPRKQAPGG